MHYLKVVIIRSQVPIVWFRLLIVTESFAFPMTDDYKIWPSEFAAGFT